MDQRSIHSLPVPKMMTRDAGDELAACLARFLNASADERTMQRSREALLRWQQLSEPAPLPIAN